MSTRLKNVQEYVNQLIANLPSPKGHHLDDDDIQVHLSGVSSCSVLLALRRGLNPELAAISGLLHDIYRFKTGISTYHSHNGAEMARVVIKRMNEYFSDDETQIILSAIFHHGEKQIIHGDYDEVLKDADTLSPFLYEGGVKHAALSLVQGARRKRLEKIANELNIFIDFSVTKADEEHDQMEVIGKLNRRLMLADTAERLATLSIEGSRQNNDYMSLVRYWPEDDAPNELINGWCAAFVFHCCQESGFLLPIKWLAEDIRFTSVAPWNTWARRLGFFIKDEPGIVPQRGDIILYRNSIPPENKFEKHRNIPIDHIGIVLANDSENFTVAEGNINNKNVSGILVRPHHQNVEGYIRIDNSFSYNDWKFNYVTKEEDCIGKL